MDTDSGICGTLKDTLSRSQATPWKGILRLSVHSPPPQDHVPKCRMGDTFFVKQLVNHQMRLHLQSETLAVVEMTALGGENPQDSDMKKGITEMSSERRVLHFHLFPARTLRSRCTSWFATDLGHKWKTSSGGSVSAYRPTRLRHPIIPLCSRVVVVVKICYTHSSFGDQSEKKMMPCLLKTLTNTWDRMRPGVLCFPQQHHPCCEGLIIHYQCLSQGTQQVPLHQLEQNVLFRNVISQFYLDQTCVG